MRILVVEDDAEAATAMVRGLTEAGHEPTHAVDGAFGLLEAQKGGYDVYVVDRMMPRLDGIGMVETLRKDGDQTPVLFLSALGEVEDRVTGLKAGADDYLVKPYAFSELIFSPSIIISVARALPIIRGSIQLAPPSGTRPILTKACKK
jgi:two-component system OmpR family response regulator